MNSTLQVTWQSVGSLHVYEHNARLHSKKQLLKLKTSIRKFGWATPLIVDENNMVLCGAGRLEAAKQLGLSEVPTIRLSHMSEADKRAFIIADNRIAEQASWSRALLRDELKGLIEVGYDVELTGFDTLEIDSKLSFDDPESKIDDDVELPGEERPVARVGDLWICGCHRLVVGDARDPLVYDTLLASERTQLVFTDPPYNCAIEGNASGLGKVKHGNFVMGAGELSMPEFAATILRPVFKQIALHASSGAIAFVCIDWRAAPHLLDAAQGVFHELKNLIVWSKTNAGMGTFYRSAHELIYAFKVSAGTHINNFGLGEGGRHRSNVWVYPGANVFRAGRMQDLADHATVKPKQLVADAILDCSKRAGIVLDCFAGSGTTLVAAQITGRKGYGIELDPKYADVILRRIAEAVGEPATLDGVPFEQVAIRRADERQEASRG